jgi:hypothetical protein
MLRRSRWKKRNGRSFCRVSTDNGLLRLIAHPDEVVNQTDYGVLVAPFAGMNVTGFIVSAGVPTTTSCPAGTVHNAGDNRLSLAHPSVGEKSGDIAASWPPRLTDD